MGYLKSVYAKSKEQEKSPNRAEDESYYICRSRILYMLSTTSHSFSSIKEDYAVLFFDCPIPPNPFLVPIPWPGRQHAFARDDEKRCKNSFFYFHLIFYLFITVADGFGTLKDDTVGMFCTEISDIVLSAFLFDLWAWLKRSSWPRRYSFLLLRLCAILFPVAEAGCVSNGTQESLSFCKNLFNNFFSFSSAQSWSGFRFLCTITQQHYTLIYIFLLTNSVNCVRSGMHCV